MPDTAPLVHARPPRRWLRGALVTLLGMLCLLGTTAPALADTPATLPAAAVPQGCAPTPTTACLTGTIRTAAGDPAVGVTVTATGNGLEVSTVTAEDGSWGLEVTVAGDYAVAVDPATLPTGETLRQPENNPRTVNVALGSTKGALFPLGSPDGGGEATAEAGATAAPTAPSTGTGETPASGGSSSSRVLQQAANGLVFGLLLALASVGLSLLYGTTGLSNFAHGEQVTFGAILAYVGTQVIGLPLLVSGVVAVAFGALSGWLQDAGIWHRLRKRRIGNTQQMIVTIGFSMVLQYAFQFFFGGGRLRIVIENPVPVRLGPITVAQQSLVSALIAVVTLGAVAWFLLGTRTGRATRAVSDNPALAAASGISVERIIRFVWTLGAGLAALGGILIALFFNATSWNMGGTILLLMFAAVTLGGLGTAFGALAGSLVIGLVAEMSSLVIPSDMRYAGALLILIVVLLVRPQGILGRAERVG